MYDASNLTQSELDAIYFKPDFEKFDFKSPGGEYGSPQGHV